jgi:hypothetical protein
LENDSANASDMEIIADVLNTAKKQKNFSTPAKKKPTEQIMDKLSMLEVTMNLISDASALLISEEGEVLNDFSFEQELYKSFCESMVEKMDILIENAKSVSDVLLDIQPFVTGQTKPIEHTVAGLKLDFAATKASIGTKNLSKKDIPPCVWSAIETGFDSFLTLEKQVEEISALAAEAHKVAGELLSTAESATTKVTFQDEKKPIENRESFLDNLSKPTIVEGRLYQPMNKNLSTSTAGGSGNNPGGSNGNGFGFSSPPSDKGCDNDELLCG